MKRNLLKNMTAAIAALFIALLALPQTAQAQSKEAYVVEDGSTLTFYYDTKKATHMGTVYGIDDMRTDDTKVPAWAGSRLDKNERTTKAVFDSSFKDYRPATTSCWFCICKTLATIEGIENLNTEEVTDMSNMFLGCSAMTSIDVTKFNTAKVTNMIGMFSACSALTTIYCNDNWKSDVVKESTGMFRGSSKLKGFANYDDTRTDVSMANPMSGYFTRKPVAYVVDNGSTLTFYYDTNKATRTGTGITIYGIDEKRTDDTDIPAWAGKYRNENERTTKAVFDSSFKNYRPTTTASWFDFCTYLETIEGIENLNTEEVTDMSRMFEYCKSLKALDFSKFNTAKVTDMDRMFNSCSALTSLDVSKFNTANVTYMLYMFTGCKALTSLDISNFNTANVTDMSGMFYCCSALTTIYCNYDWTKGVVKQSEDMFYDCTKLKGAVPFDATKTDVTMANPTTGYFTKKGGITPVAYVVEYDGTLTFYYDTEKYTRIGYIYDINQKKDGSVPIWAGKNIITKVVFDKLFKDYRPTTTASWFYSCKNLETVEGIEYLNTEEVTDMSRMFAGCNALTALDVSKFNTAKVTDMSYMFLECSSLTSLNVSSFNTAKVTNMSGMFAGSALTTLDLTSFNTANVTDMSDMFAFCDKLTSLDLSKFNTEKVTNMTSMFWACEALTTIYCDDDWTKGVVTESENMFADCTKLKGAVAYDANRTDVTMANPTTGYFTKKGEITPVAYVVEYDGTLTFYYDTEKYTRIGYIYDINQKKDGSVPIWAGKNIITKVVFDKLFKDYRPTTTASWFYSCKNLETVEGIEYLNTEEVTDMSRMFAGCNALTALDVSKFNTAKVTDMSYMFLECSSLTSLNVSSFNTAKVTNMSGMFAGSALTTLDLTSFNTANVTDMSDMFAFCDKLTSLDLSKFNTEKVTNMTSMFWACEALTTIYCDDDWTKGVVTESENMFADCTKLKGAVAYDANRTDVTMANPTTGYFTKIGEITPVAYVVEDGSTLTFYYDTEKATRTGTGITIYGIDEKRTDNTDIPAWAGKSSNENVRTTKAVFDSSFKNYRPTTTASWFYCCKKLETIEGMENLNTEEVTDMGGMFEYCESLKALDVSKFNTAKVTNMWSMFDGCSSLTSLDVSKFNTANVTNMIYMFSDCSALTSLDVSNFNTGNVTNMYGMFYDCSSLTSLDVSKFNTANVTNMNGMFSGCSSLKSLNLSSLNTEKVTDMSEMFWGCESLTSLDVSNFNTANVTDMSGMFCCCSGLEALDVSNFNTAKVTEMNYMFLECSSLTSLNVSKLNTANVTDMSEMFSGCSSLKSLNLSSLNTEKVTNMSEMFSGCKSLTSLDVSNFNTANVTYMMSMFWACEALTTIYCDDDWTKGVVTVSENMFADCTKLKGAVAYDANRTDVTMANPTTGYFTSKNTTGIDAATVDTPAARRGIYTLNGVRLNTSPDNLPAGIYVIDGRKVVKR